MNVLDRLFGQPQPNRLETAGQPQASAMDVWTGKADEGIASNGDILRRLPNGDVERVSAKFGYSEVLPGESGAPAPSYGFGGQVASAPKRDQPSPTPERPPNTAPPTPGQSRGGGLGGFIGNLFGGGQKQAGNQTIGWLQRQGLDEGTAALVAQNRPLLQSFIKDRYEDRLKGSEPVDYDFMNVDGTLVRTNPRSGEVTEIGRFGNGNTATDDIREYQFARQNGFEGSFADWKNAGGAKPSAIQEYEYAKQQGFPGTFQDWEASKKGGMSLQVDPATGAVTFQQGGNIKPMTEGQSKDTVFATRAEGALPLINQYGEALTRFDESLGGRVPFVGNYMKSDEFQQAEQAGKEFLQAILRKDTGAAITNEETAEYGTVYLPRPGDSPAVLEQKRQSRQRALEAIKAGMPPQAILAQEKALARTGGAPATAPAQGQDWQDLGNDVKIRRVQ